MNPAVDIGPTQLGPSAIQRPESPDADLFQRLAPTGPDLLGAMDEETLALLRRPVGARRRGLIARSLLFADIASLTLAYLIATALWDRHGVFGSSHELIGFLGVLPCWLLIAKLAGLYRRDTESPAHSTTDDLFGVVRLVTVGVWLLFIAERLTGRADPAFNTLAAYWLISICLVPAARMLSRQFCRRLRSYQQNTLILGAGDVGQLIGRKLLRHPEYGLNVVGFVDREPKARHTDLPARLGVLGEPDRLPEIIDSLAVERVVIAFSNESTADLIPLLRKLAPLDVQVDLVPRLFELIGSRVIVHAIEGIPLVGLPPARPTSLARALKRGIDVCGATIGLVALSPLLGLIALRVKLEAGGPVLLRQTRLGQAMMEFTTYKFRTQDPDGVSTRFEAFLRRTGLDELPQLVNVLRGDMSLVGPRPYFPQDVKRFELCDLERFSVPPGLTGLWQVTARGTSSFSESLKMDVAYARGWSLGLDVLLLLRTPSRMFRRKAAAR
jgi:exopolysaccharide biosynthesis polyprenyl glycosylphosphotransferase